VLPGAAVDLLDAAAARLSASRSEEPGDASAAADEGDADDERGAADQGERELPVLDAARLLELRGTDDPE
jgi:hypothetical protein